MQHITDPITSDFRTPGESDQHKITFSNSFRLLAGKAQVHSPRAHDDIRSRLTHSLEVSCVAGSLATHIAHAIGPEKIPTGLLCREVDTIKNAAIAGALMHDMGNTPFSHPGETAIRIFFEKHAHGHQLLSKIPEAHRESFLSFHGNMQAFRLATTTGWKGSMNLTPLTLAAFCKYPTVHDPEGKLKNGIFHSDLDAWKQVARSLGLQTIRDKPEAWHRHIVSYITEAADDICYLTADLEDAATLGIVPIQTVIDFLIEIAGVPPKGHTPENHRSIFASRQSPTPAEIELKQRNEIRYYRSQAIAKLILRCTEIARNNQRQLLMPETFNTPLPPLISLLENAETLSRIRKYSKKHIYDQRILGSTTDSSVNTPQIMYKLCCLFASEILTPGSTNEDIAQTLSQSCIDPEASPPHQLVDALTSLSDANALALSSHTGDFWATHQIPHFPNN